MVMETPSPQCVGREFVRQYYTLMNEAPDYLHRFYSSSSSFIHSGVDTPGQEAEPVYGQKEIHKKIIELNFADCHTKIRQVDSQATVGEGVVVQVTGELSNNGGPMRRFMQTFVLAHQNPKQYYVHNDIFRYQDEVFQDSYESEDETEHVAPEAGVAPGIENGNAEPVEPELPEEIEVPLPAEPVIQESPVKIEARHSPEPVQADSPHQEEPTPADIEEPEVQVEPPTDHQVTPEEPEAEIAAPLVTSDNELNQPPKQFSWANVVNKPSGPSIAVVPPMNNATQKNPATVPSLTAVMSSQKEEGGASPVIPISAPRDEPPTTTQQTRSARSSVEPAGFGKRPPRPEGGFDPAADRGGMDRRNNEKYPDSQQVFVGNLPVDIAELNLKRFFMGYGKVIDIRINRGGNNKVPFGFVVFDNEEPVKKLLALQRVEMDGHRLNVEVKKARSERGPPRARQQIPRGNSRPKDRENSGSRSENRLPPQGGRQFTSKR